MNLLGHFACARHLPPPAQLGSVLGDLLPLHERRARLLPLARAWRAEPDGDARMAELVDGVDFHLAVDSRFHRDPLFTETAAAVMAALRAAGPRDGLKRFLPAHVMSELYLDHVLLTDDPALGDAFYAALGPEGRALMTRFADRHEAVAADDFDAFLRSIVEGGFLEAYREPAGLVLRMQRILRRFAQRPLRPAESEAVLAALDTARPTLRRRLLQFMRAMRDSGGGRDGGTARLAPDDPELPRPPGAAGLTESRHRRSRARGAVTHPHDLAAGRR